MNPDVLGVFGCCVGCVWVLVDQSPPAWLKSKGFTEADWNAAVTKAESKGLLTTGKEFGIVVSIMKNMKKDKVARLNTAKKGDLKDACWEGYEAIGLKPGKGGKKVPNCVPKK